MSVQIIQSLFDSSGKTKIDFKPEIRITTPGSPVWVDNIFKVREQLIITVSTGNDTGRMNINAVDGPYLVGIQTRLETLYGKKNVPAKKN